MLGLREFVAESNHIEGIDREPTYEEIAATTAFLDLKEVTTADMEQLVGVYAPGKKLRERYGMDVVVGGYAPPLGGPEIRQALDTLLERVSDRDPMYKPWQTHVAYEMLHPFMDGNGRSGRALWLWQMRTAPIGFLHKFYYQTLSEVGRKK